MSKMPAQLWMYDPENEVMIEGRRYRVCASTLPRSHRCLVDVETGATVVMEANTHAAPVTEGETNE